MTHFSGNWLYICHKFVSKGHARKGNSLILNVLWTKKWLLACTFFLLAIIYTEQQPFFFILFFLTKKHATSKAQSNLWRNLFLCSCPSTVLTFFFFFLHNVGAKSFSPLPHTCLWGSPLLFFFFYFFAPLLSSTLLSTFALLHERLINCILELFTPLSPFHLLSSLHPNPSWTLNWYLFFKMKTFKMIIYSWNNSPRDKSIV